MLELAALVDILAELAPVAVREGDIEGLRQHIERVTLDLADCDGYRMTDVGHRLRDFKGGFVYDRTAGVIFACRYGSHSRTAAALARLRALPFPLPEVHAELYHLMCQGEKEVDRFLNEGWGFVVNTPALSGVDLDRPWPVRLGEAVRLTTQEKLWFRSFALLRKD